MRIILLFCILLAACSKASINANFEEIRDRIKDNIEKNLSVGAVSSKCDGMAFVEGGTFTMTKGSRNLRRPEHEVTVSSFYMAKCELRLGEWINVMGANSSEIDEIKKLADATQSISADTDQIAAMALSYLQELGATEHELNDESMAALSKAALTKFTDDVPMLVSWYAAAEYCNRRSLAEGLMPVYSWKDDEIVADWNANGYRLPTEAEWEYAAQGGNRRQPFEYSGSDDADAVGWYDDNSWDRIHLAASKEANTLGIYDMSGNVEEWVWDLDSQYYFDWAYVAPPDAPMAPYGGMLLALDKGLVNPIGPSFEQAEKFAPKYSDYTYTPERVVRGGSWRDPEWYLSPTSQKARTPKSLVGVRVVRRDSANAD